MLYTLSRRALGPLARLIYRPVIEGQENIPRTGPLLLASNHLSFVDSIVIPLQAEARWQQAFGFVRATDEETRQIAGFPWEPKLCFVREALINIPFDELRKINDFIKTLANPDDLVPIKERSIEIFGDEKRLDLLAD